MWRHAERLTEITPRRLFYTVDTCPGHSGSPVWYRRRADGRRVIIGVHTSGVVDEQGRSFGCSPGTVLAPAGMRNSGVRITPEVLAGIRRPGAQRPDLRTMQRLC
jgi:glutamyl endopeptidase